MPGQAVIRRWLSRPVVKAIEEAQRITDQQFIQQARDELAALVEATEALVSLTADDRWAATDSQIAVRCGLRDLIRDVEAIQETLHNQKGNPE